MLEERIASLETEIVTLRQAIVGLTAALCTIPAVGPVTSDNLTGSQLFKLCATDPVVPEPAAPAPPAVTHDDLQALCLSIVRADRSKRDAIKAAVASFGGAAVLADVPAGDLPALKLLIEKLQ